MQKILRKRVLRDFRANLFHWISLGLLIVLCMYLIVSLVAAAETVIIRSDENAGLSHLEDGEFSTFIPLTDRQKEKLTSTGADLEEMFYLDFPADGESTLRVYKNRERLNQIILDSGRLARNTGEVVLEKRYSQERRLSVGDTVLIGTQELNVVGIGAAADYDVPLKEFSDSNADSAHFGLAFVTAGQYESLKSEGDSMQSESCTYAYALNGKVKGQEIKELLKGFDFSPEEVEDDWFQEYWDRTGGKKEEIEDGVDDLADGAGQLKDGLGELKKNNGDLTEGAASIFDSYLKEASEGLASYGLTEELTEANYGEVLSGLSESSDSAIFRLQVNMTLDSLNQLKQYKDGVFHYTDGVSEAADGSGELYDGTAELQRQTQELLDQYFDADIENLTQFVPAEDNPRIKAAAGDQIINKVGGLTAGVIVLVLVSYVISVFTIHNIEEESSVIGSLYALGVKKKELIRHYLTLPVIVTSAAGMIGTAIGFSPLGIDVQMQDCYDYFSVPELSPVYPVYLLIYGILVPPVLAALVNYFIMNKKLGRPALSLIQKEQKGKRARNIRLGNLGFIGKFRIRQMLRELRSTGAVILGMFISLLILMLGANCFVMTKHISEQNRADTKYDYMYTCKYPDEQVPNGGEGACAVSLKRENLGYQLDVTLLGLGKNNPYFDVKVGKGESRIVLSSAAAQKFHLKEGDQIVLTDQEDDRDYAFTVGEVVQYSTALYAFMDIDSMRSLFDLGDDYYNVVFSDQELDIPSGRLYAVTTKADIIKGADIFIDKMMPLIWMMTGVSVLVFCVVMYLMMKVMIDRSSYGISLIKVFGYRTKEVRRLYLDGNFYMIAAGAAVCVPLSKKAMDLMYPVMVANVGCAMDLHFTWQLYLGIYAGIILLYFIINQILTGRLKKIMPAVILKDRE